MKLSLALGLLTQSLPCWSAKFSPQTLRTTFHDGLTAIAHQATGQNLGKRRGFHTKRSLKVQPEGVLRNMGGTRNNHIPCDPNTVDGDIVLSCGKNQFCKPHSASDLGGICASISETKRGTTAGYPLVGFVPSKSMDPAPSKGNGGKHPCDPASIDLGILACRDGEFCQQDESSELGGFCAQNAYPHRRLYDLEYMLALCDYFPARCDCSDVNTTTGNGRVYCLADNLTYGKGCDDVVYSDTYWIDLANSKATKMYDCYEITTPSNEKFCITSYGEYFNESCSFSFNGQDCDSCAVNEDFFDFDCSNVEGGRVGSTRVEASSILTECFVQPTYNCTNICGQGFYIPEKNSNIGLNVIIYTGEVTCGQLLYWDENVMIPDYRCSEAMDMAQKYCCEPLGPKTSPQPTKQPTVPPQPTKEPATPEPDASTGLLPYAKYTAGLMSLGFLVSSLLLEGS